MKRARLVQWGVGILAVCLVTSACGGDDSSSSSSAAPSSGPALSGAPIKIGFAVSETGVQSSSTAASVPTAEAWADQINNTGGLGGRPVEIVVADTKNNAGSAQAAVRGLVEDQQIVAMLLSDSVAEGAVGDYLQQQNIPVIGAAGYKADVWNGLSNFFTTAPNAGMVVQSLATSGKAADAKVLSAGVCAESATCADDASKALAPAAAANDMKYGGAVTISATAANYTAECLNFNKQNADYVALLVTVDTSVRVMTDCIQQGFDGTFGTSSTSFNPTEYGKVAGMKMAGTLNGFPWWADSEPVKKFRDALDTYKSGTDYTSTSATTTWSSLELFRTALGSNTADVTRQSVFDGYYSLKDETLGGLLPQPVTFTKGQPSPQIKCFWQFKFNAGDDSPELLAPSGESGNGDSGDLATACAA
ncbi:ABC transporter substrate-binding protein [Williamsia muralis]|uniref:Leucine-binding protein domain-containing protein n=1 Tax=Williamsia marianensis TaxID=85044 RepID=A0A2G3PGH6_WILMA|nr:ABC transporter substrate-binding protein [Williamsia marianensis]PHV64909.1 hypothetical protein CSW57_21840 [Williamsia marianensis]